MMNCFLVVDEDVFTVYEFFSRYAFKAQVNGAWVTSAANAAGSAGDGAVYSHNPNGYRYYTTAHITHMAHFVDEHDTSSAR